MSKPLTEPKDEAKPDGPPPLSANVRRHLGRNLRSVYAPTLDEPVGERIEALLARLAKQTT